MAIDPIKIPQNVYIEDRIVGPLTLKQIITVAIGCGFSYALYSMLLRSYGALPLPITVIAWVPGGVSAVFAFLRINDLSLFRICLLMLERFNKPATRTWAPRRGIVVNIRTFNAPEQQRQPTSATETGSKLSQLDELTPILDHSLPSHTLPDEPISTDEEELYDERPMTPVDPRRISASPLDSTQSMDIHKPDPSPMHGSVSIFRDISPR